MRPTSACSGLRGPALNLCDIIQRGYLSQVHLLVSLGVNLEARDQMGRTPLMLTAFVEPEGWGVGVARLLIERGVCMSQRDRQGMNALHHACVYERLPLARVLLNAPDFDLLQGDRYGNTALHYAAMSGNPTLLRLLIAHHRRYRHPLTKVNRKGHTARDKALHYGHHLCAAILDESASTSGQTKEGDNHSECESSPSVFVRKEESIATSESVKAVSMEESKVGEEGNREGGGEELKLSLRREDEEGGLFRASEQPSQEDLNKNLFLSPFHTPQTSDRSSDNKSRSQNTSPRTRRSGIRRAHPPAGLRKLSAGSCSSSTRSATSAHKQPFLSPHSSNDPPTTITTTTTITNNTVKNSSSDSPNMENESTEPVSEVLQRSKSPSLQSLKRGSVLSENTFILNNANNTNIIHTTNNTIQTNNSTINNNSMEAFQLHSVSRPPLKSPGLHSFRGKDPTFLTRASPLPMPYEKDPERVIHAASEHDFRNTREYVLKLTRLEFIPAHFAMDTLPLLVPSPPPVPPEEEGCRKVHSAGSWRDNIRFLYRHLEYQCSPSWRDAALPPPEPVTMIPRWGVTSPTGAAGEEGEAETSKEKKVRRPSSSSRPASQMNDVSTSSNVKRKSSTNKQRKISAISPPSGVGKGEGGQGDSLTTSSSDSVTSSSKKKLDSRPDQQGSNRPQ